MATQKRRTLSFGKLQNMLPQQLDKLPSPAEFYCDVGTKKKPKILRLRKRWVGFTWVDEGNADGTEPLLIVE